jgi:anaerobic C4-dicarboxylate transporter
MGKTKFVHRPVLWNSLSFQMLVRGKPVETAMVGMVEAILGKYLSQVRALSIYIASSLDGIVPINPKIFETET